MAMLNNQMHIYIYTYINISLFKWQMFLVTYGSWLVYLAHWWPKNRVLLYPVAIGVFFLIPSPITTSPFLWSQWCGISHPPWFRWTGGCWKNERISHFSSPADLLWSARPNHLASFTFPSSSSGKQRFDECRWDSFRTKLDMKESMDVHGCPWFLLVIG